MDKKEGNLTVTLLNPEGKLKNGEQDIMLEFTDGSGKPVDIKSASLNFNRNPSLLGVLCRCMAPPSRMGNALR